jgi:hypothetical protein
MVEFNARIIESANGCDIMMYSYRHRIPCHWSKTMMEVVCCVAKVDRKCYFHFTNTTGIIFTIVRCIEIFEKSLCHLR